MEEQTAISLVQAVYILIALIGVLVFMCGSVILAEFIRRERTATKDDDWIGRKPRTEGTPCLTCRCQRAVHIQGFGVCKGPNCGCQVFTQE